MSTAFIAPGAAFRHSAPASPGHVRVARIGHWFRVGATAPHAWGAAHRCVAAAAAAVAAFACSWYGAHVAGLDGHLAGQPAPAELARRVEAARARVAELPSVRGRMQAGPERNPDVSSSAGPRWQAVSTLAARHGMTIRTLEPRAVVGDGPHAVRPVRMSARTSFAGLVGFVQRLSTLPVLVVPVEFSVEQADGMLLLETTLRVHEGLPASPIAREGEAAPDGQRARGEERQPWFHDPFDVSRQQAARQVRAVRLLGTMRDGHRSIAVLDTSEGTMVRLAGQAVGLERLVRIGPRAVTLAGQAGERVMTLAEEAS
ncbi:hypothetical protein WKR88_25410 [Trinickia caryophylli]|uniref:Tfp pilus assembly protein PilO n=1 Tax=Trinickia caryophylli TaxID=28094 RepID=A0A1X7F679_TRICW|nr:hypothetical protein [Trinickia caryophylli]TRX19415.1 hypothetical protein FNF07_15085 [Trinickia caryophylli]WQE13278.1 hypothetical protein U0034_07865 [Trinickia caryophylli]SMF46020.1 hypothetical protein SAMN06295900_107170 [Trinickia caryophylli]